MSVQDILVGSKKVRVETTSSTYEFNLKNKNGTVVTAEDVPDEVESALNEQGIWVDDGSPTEIVRYIHDEATRGDKEQVAEKLGVDEDSEVVRDVAGYGYEVKLTFKVESDSGIRTAFLTHIDGHELKQPKEI
jgi:hypothetical protein